MWESWTKFLNNHPKINGAIVVAEGAALGGAGTVVDNFLSGDLTLSKAGIHKAAGYILSAVIIALRMAYGRNPKKDGEN